MIKYRIAYTQYWMKNIHLFTVRVHYDNHGAPNIRRWTQEPTVDGGKS